MYAEGKVVCTSWRTQFHMDTNQLSKTSLLLFHPWKVQWLQQTHLIFYQPPILCVYTHKRKFKCALCVVGYRCNYQASKQWFMWYATNTLLWKHSQFYICVTSVEMCFQFERKISIKKRNLLLKITPIVSKSLCLWRCLKCEN